MDFTYRLLHRVNQAPSLISKIKTIRGAYCRRFHRPVFYDNPPTAGKKVVQDLSCVKCGYVWREYESHDFSNKMRIQRMNADKESNTGREVTSQNVKYGMLVEVLLEHGGYHVGCKVHFFNKKGVLVGNYYEFLPYSRLRLRKPHKGRNRTFQMFFMGTKFAKTKRFFFKALLAVTSMLIRFTQRHMD